MNGYCPFEINLPAYEVDGDTGEKADLTVTGVYAHDRGNMKGHPDTWRPGAFEIEDIVVRDENGKAYPELARDEYFMREIVDRIMDLELEAG